MSGVSAVSGKTVMLGEAQTFATQESQSVPVVLIDMTSLGDPASAVEAPAPNMAAASASTGRSPTNRCPGLAVACSSMSDLPR